MKYEEAAVKAEISRKEQLEKFCPLSQVYCKKECVAFHDAQVIGTSEEKDGYEYYNAYCTAHCIVGNI